MKTQLITILMLIILLVMIVDSASGCTPTENVQVWGKGDPPADYQELFGNDNGARLDYVQTQAMNKVIADVKNLDKLNSKQHTRMGEMDISLHVRLEALEDIANKQTATISGLVDRIVELEATELAEGLLLDTGDLAIKLRLEAVEEYIDTMKEIDRVKELDRLEIYEIDPTSSKLKFSCLVYGHDANCSGDSYVQAELNPSLTIDNTTPDFIIYSDTAYSNAIGVSKPKPYLYKDPIEQDPNSQDSSFFAVGPNDYVCSEHGRSSRGNVIFVDADGEMRYCQKCVYGLIFAYLNNHIGGIVE